MVYSAFPDRKQFQHALAQTNRKGADMEYQAEFAASDDFRPANDEVFRRVASTDSPFREIVTWAYLGVTGRPGGPQIDTEKWLAEISSHFSSGGHS